jgi:hypothetical protein
MLDLPELSVSMTRCQALFVRIVPRSWDLRSRFTQRKSIECAHLLSDCIPVLLLRHQTIFNNIKKETTLIKHNTIQHSSHNSVLFPPYTCPKGMSMKFFKRAQIHQKKNQKKKTAWVVTHLTTKERYHQVHTSRPNPIN